MYTGDSRKRLFMDSFEWGRNIRQRSEEWDEQWDEQKNMMVEVQRYIPVAPPITFEKGAGFTGAYWAGRVRAEMKRCGWVTVIVDLVCDYGVVEVQAGFDFKRMMVNHTQAIDGIINELRWVNASYNTDADVDFCWTSLPSIEEVLPLWFNFVERCKQERAVIHDAIVDTGVFDACECGIAYCPEFDRDFCSRYFMTHLRKLPVEPVVGQRRYLRFRGMDGDEEKWTVREADERSSDFHHYSNK